LSLQVASEERVGALMRQRQREQLGQADAAIAAMKDAARDR